MADFALDDGVKAIAITSTTPCGNEDLQELVDAIGAIDDLAAAVSLDASILTLTLADGREARFALYAADAPHCNVLTGTLAGVIYDLTAAGDSNGVYTGTIAAAASALVGKSVVIDGFAETDNNGTFIVTANNGSTTITTSNLSSVSETHAGTATVASEDVDKWTVDELARVLGFVQAAMTAIRQFTITAFTVTYS